LIRFLLLYNKREFLGGARGHVHDDEGILYIISSAHCLSQATSALCYSDALSLCIYIVLGRLKKMSQLVIVDDANGGPEIDAQLVKHTRPSLHDQLKLLACAMDSDEEDETMSTSALSDNETGGGRFLGNHIPGHKTSSSSSSSSSEESSSEEEDEDDFDMIGDPLPGLPLTDDDLIRASPIAFKAVVAADIAAAAATQPPPPPSAVPLSNAQSEAERVVELKRRIIAREEERRRQAEALSTRLNRADPSNPIKVSAAAASIKAEAPPSAKQEGLFSFFRSKFVSYKFEPAEMHEGDNDIPTPVLSSGNMTTETSDYEGLVNMSLKGSHYQFTGAGDDGMVETLAGSPNVFIFEPHGSAPMRNDFFTLNNKRVHESADARFEFHNPMQTKEEIDVYVKGEPSVITQLRRSSIWVAYIGWEDVCIVLRFNESSGRLEQLVLVTVETTSSSTKSKVSATAAAIAPLGKLTPAESQLLQFILKRQSLDVHALVETQYVPPLHAQTASTILNTTLACLRSHYAQVKVPKFGRGHTHDPLDVDLLASYAKEQHTLFQRQQTMGKESTFHVIHDLGTHFATHLIGELDKQALNDSALCEVMHCVQSVKAVLGMIYTQGTAEDGLSKVNQMWLDARPEEIKNPRVLVDAILK